MPLNRRRQDNHHAIENPTHAADKSFRLNRRDRRGKKIGRIGGPAARGRAASEYLRAGYRCRAAFMLLRGEQQFVDRDATRPIGHAWIDHKRAVELRMGILNPFGNSIDEPISIFTSSGVTRSQSMNA